MKIALINMPFGSLYRPSIGLSLLKAAVESDHVECNIHYLNLHFANMIGIKNYQYITEGALPINAFVGEWIFSRSLFGMDTLDEYEKYYRNNYWDKSSDMDSFFVFLSEMSEKAEQFIKDVLFSYPWEEYDLIGFTSVFDQNMASLSFAKLLKQKYPDKFIIFGGPNMEGPMGIGVLKEFPFVDAVCSGEGDISFPRFINQFVESKDPLSCQVKGITQQKDLDLLHEEPEGSDPVSDMNELPFPKYDDFYVQFIQYGFESDLSNTRYLFESSRGCWWGAKQHCLFCGLNGSNLNYRSKSSERALEELIYLSERYGKYTQKASAVDNIIDMKYFKELLPKIKERGMDLDMFYETKANLTKEQVKLFKEAGFHSIQPGIESMITSVLRLMNKGVSMLQNVQLLKWSKEYNVEPMWNFLYGFPGEDIEEYDKVLDLLQSLSHLTPPGASGPIRLDRFSPYFNNPNKYQMDNVRPMASYPIIYKPISTPALMNIAYHFEFDYMNDQKPASYTKELKRELKKWQDEYEESELMIIDKGEHLIFVDFRSITALNDNPIYSVSGLEKSIYQYCSALRSIKTIYKHLENLNYDMTYDEIYHILQSFIERRTMISEKDIYLSLAIPLDEYVPKKKVLQRLSQLSG